MRQRAAVRPRCKAQTVSPACDARGRADVAVWPTISLSGPTLPAADSPSRVTGRPAGLETTRSVDVFGRTSVTGVGQAARIGHDDADPEARAGVVIGRDERRRANADGIEEVVLVTVIGGMAVLEPDVPGEGARRQRAVLVSVACAASWIESPTFQQPRCKSAASIVTTGAVLPDAIVLVWSMPSARSPSVTVRRAVNVPPA